MSLEPHSLGCSIILWRIDCVMGKRESGDSLSLQILWEPMRWGMNLENLEVISNVDYIWHLKHMMLPWKGHIVVPCLIIHLVHVFPMTQQSKWTIDAMASLCRGLIPVTFLPGVYLSALCTYKWDRESVVELEAPLTKSTEILIFFYQKYCNISK